MNPKAGAAICIAALVLCSITASAQQAGVIPLPAQITPGNGAFELSAATVIQAPQANRDAAEAARYLSELWKRTNGLILPIVSRSALTSADSLIRFEQTPGYGPEAYRVDVAPHRITVSASTAAGLLYGAVTLWQLLPVGPKSGQIAAQTIVDEPRYAWRGLMLDSSRHFQSPAFVHSMIDWMAWHKLNILHWHLTDDQGWRIEIRKYPRLTSVGAWRIPAVVPGTPAPGRYGGFYSQDEVRNIVRFAATRNVQIIPEIDMPGHAQAAIAAYPALGSLDAKPTLPVSNRWGVHTHLFNLEPATFEFLENVLGEILQLFPSRFIHIGGDEAVKDEWNASAQVQARARKLGIHDAAALQVYFTQRLSRYLAVHGRRTVGWDEILQPGVSTGAVIMAWHGASGAHAAALKGHDTVLAPDPALYFDHRQSRLPNEPPGRLDVISLEDVYRFEPQDPKLTDEQQRHILGLQADIWTEHIPTEQRVQWMALPRAAALAEVGWSAQKRNWPDFLKRLSSMSARYRAFDLHYADSAFIVPGADQRMAARRTSHELDLCSDGVGLLLETRHARSADETPLAVDIMNPCWIYRDVDLTQGPQFTAAVSALPFNYELGQDAAKIRVGDNTTPTGELEVRVDDCAGAILKVLPLPPASSADGLAELPAQKLPPLAGRHDVCLRFARPSLDPLWALDWVEIGG